MQYLCYLYIRTSQWWGGSAVRIYKITHFFCMYNWSSTPLESPGGCFKGCFVARGGDGGGGVVDVNQIDVAVEVSVPICIGKTPRTRRDIIQNNNNNNNNIVCGKRRIIPIGAHIYIIIICIPCSIVALSHFDILFCFAVLYIRLLYPIRLSTLLIMTLLYTCTTSPPPRYSIISKV